MKPQQKTEYGTVVALLLPSGIMGFAVVAGFPVGLVLLYVVFAMVLAMYRTGLPDSLGKLAAGFVISPVVVFFYVVGQLGSWAISSVAIPIVLMLEAFCCGIFAAVAYAMYQDYQSKVQMEGEQQAPVEGKAAKPGAQPVPAEQEPTDRYQKKLAEETRPTPQQEE